MFFAAVPLGIIASLLAGSLQGVRAFFAYNSTNLLATTLLTVTPLAAALLVGPDLPTLLAAALLARVGGLLPQTWAVARLLPLSAPALASASEGRALMQFGGWVTIGSIVAPLLVYWDRFVIGAKLGTAAVAAYTIPFNVVVQLSLVPAALASALLPRLARISPGAEQDERAATALLFALMTPAAIGLLLLLPGFLTLWVGHDVASSASLVGEILSLGLWINGFARLPHAKIHAQGRPRTATMFLLLEVIPYAVLLLVLIAAFGLAGAAAAWSLRCLADTLLLLWASKDLRSLASQLIIHGLILALALVATTTLAALSYWRLPLALIFVSFAFFLTWRHQPALRLLPWSSLMPRALKQRRS